MVEVVVGAAALPFPVQKPTRLFFIPFVSSILGPILDGQEGVIDDETADGEDGQPGRQSTA